MVTKQLFAPLGLPREKKAFNFFNSGTIITSQARVLLFNFRSLTLIDNSNSSKRLSGSAWIVGEGLWWKLNVLKRLIRTINSLLRNADCYFLDRESSRKVEDEFHSKSISDI